MDKFTYIFKSQLKSISAYLSSLSNSKRIILFTLAIFGFFSALRTSYMLGEDVCKNFVLLGAHEKAFTALYALFTANSTLYNILNGDKFYLTDKEKHIKDVNFYTVTISSLVYVYLVNLAFAFYYVGIPVITQGIALGIGGFRLTVIVLSVFFMPMLPLAISAPLALLLPKKRNRRLMIFINCFVLTSIAAVSLMLFSGLNETMSSKAYIISTFFSRFYFPAAFLESFIKNGSGMIIFITTNLSAFCLSILLLNKYNRK